MIFAPLRYLGLCMAAALATAAAAQSPATKPGMCPAGVEIAKTSVRNVADIFRIRALYPGKQVNFVGIELANADFSRRDVSGLCFSQSKLPQSDWTDAKGIGTRFELADLTGSRWTGFRGNQLVFNYSKLDRANMTRAKLTDTIFHRTSMEEVDASYADLSGGSFRGNALDSLKQAQFRFADLSGFRFECGIGQEDNCGNDSSDVSLAGANLTDASILMAWQSGWDLTGAVLDRTRLNVFQLDWIRPARLRGPVILEPAEWTAVRQFEGHRAAPSGIALTPAETKAVWRAMDRLAEPGFACARARSSAERYICGTRYDDRAGRMAGASEFAEADRDLNEAYVRAWRQDRTIVREQRRWLRERDACMALEEGWLRKFCISDAYASRTESLRRIAGNDPDLTRGQRRLYVDAQTAEFVAAVDDATLRAKLAPLALWNSWEVVLIERDPAGRLHAEGQAIGPNWHLGSLSSPQEGLVFDPVSGFYGDRERCLRTWTVCPIVRFDGRLLQVGPTSDEDPVTGERGFNDFIVLGAHASFGRMVQVPLDGAGMASAIGTLVLPRS